ncbi:MAG: hypothetical protein Q4G14_12470 [Paracoccus sp. (in: a-proteobacteria)]|uniref:hypothetical protein n=1 Tax=Paracoccus sp. TaxID=267 RepID=UPI0026DF453B|nr:hypothetical protein [Paracoccus sp. (in: a-proteobacteria)]MDO5614039.1 hypothetical protein [Paracoccus sp. (in: a-proteobacteria)]
MIKTVLLLLTLTADGEIRVNLTETEGPDDCEARQDVVTQVLTGAGMAPLHAICGPSALRLTPFDHAALAEDENHRYRVELPRAGGFTIRPLSGDEGCDPAPDADPAVYCARSSQAVIDDPS